MGQQRINIYRFRDRIGLHFVGESGTIYLSAEIAKNLANALIKYSEDILNYDFVDSPISSCEITEKEGSRYI